MVDGKPDKAVRLVDLVGQLQEAGPTQWVRQLLLAALQAQPALPLFLVDAARSVRPVTGQDEFGFDSADTRRFDVDMGPDGFRRVDGATGEPSTGEWSHFDRRDLPRPTLAQLEGRPQLVGRDGLLRALALGREWPAVCVRQVDAASIGQAVEEGAADRNATAPSTAMPSDANPIARAAAHGTAAELFGQSTGDAAAQAHSTKPAVAPGGFNAAALADLPWPLVEDVDGNIELYRRWRAAGGSNVTRQFAAHYGVTARTIQERIATFKRNLHKPAKRVAAAPGASLQGVVHRMGKPKAVA
jgi:hypothetical protein